ncbi:MAG: hypothetical protein V4510_00370 [bacterium]
MRGFLVALVVVAALSAGCASTKPYDPNGQGTTNPGDRTFDEAPTISFNKASDPSGGGTLTVNQADPNVPWSTIQVGVNGGNPAPISTTAGAARCSASTVTGNVAAGQVITCGTSVTSVSVAYMNNGQSTLLATFRFP